MANSECSPEEPEWTDTAEGSGARYTTTIQCRWCGTGHLIEFRPLTPGTVQVNLRIFPAKETTSISRFLILWAFESWGQTCQEIEGDGYKVIRGTPEILAPEIA
jgi:hypothetical protein